MCNLALQKSTFFYIRSIVADPNVLKITVKNLIYIVLVLIIGFASLMLK